MKKTPPPKWLTEPARVAWLNFLAHCQRSKISEITASDFSLLADYCKLISEIVETIPEAENLASKFDSEWATVIRRKKKLARQIRFDFDPMPIGTDPEFLKLIQAVFPVGDSILQHVE